jgi:choline dehydrogenase-like flavoprotein
MPPHNHDGTGRPHLWIPWWKSGSKNDFLRGYHILFVGGRNVPLAGSFGYVAEISDGYGIELKRRCRELFGSYIYFIGSGEMISNEKSYCEIDRNVMDCWGIPTLRFHFGLGDNELKMITDMQRSFRAIIEAGGGIFLQDTAEFSGNPGGEGFQEQGTVRMGTDPKMSALNAFCQTHDVKNLFVMDAGCFVSSSDKPATLTILALAWRASEYLLKQAKAGYF